MPQDRDDAAQRLSMANFRQQLIETTSGTDLHAGNRTLRISNVPLFRYRDGALCQAIRIRLDAGPAIAMSVTDPDGTMLDSTTAPEHDKPQSVYLLIPEVTTNRPVTVSSGDTSTAFEVTPQRKFSVHLVLHSHYDIGYTDPQAIVNVNQLAFIDSAIDLALATADWPDDARFRWNIEVNWPLREWLRTRSGKRRQQLLDLVAEGRIEVHALPFSMHTEAFSQDELAHQLDFTAELRREYGIEIVSAMQTDVPGATIGLSSLLTDAGVKYLAVAHNYAGRSIPFMLDGQQLKRPFWWQAPDGEKLLVWYTDTLFGIAYMEAITLGIGKDYNEFLGSLPEYLNAITQLPYPYLQDTLHDASSTQDSAWTREPYEYDVIHFRVQSAFADNAAPSFASAEIARDWNAEWEWPRLQTSTDRRFFEEILDRHGDQFETCSGDWTDWWADGIGSAARELAMNRHTQAEIQTTQTLHALAGALSGEILPTVQEEIDLTYREMALFDEHTWGAGNPWENQHLSFNSGELQWMHKASFAHRARERSILLHDAGLQRLRDFAAVPVSRPHARAILVFNPSSWVRTDLVRVFIPEDIAHASEYAIVDTSTGSRIPVVFEPQTNWAHRARGVYAHFLVKDIPATGYARYEFIPAWETAESTTPPEGFDLASEHLRVTIDPATATVASIVDIASQRELVSTGNAYGFNAYVHDRYASAPTFNHLSGRIGHAGSWMLGARGTGKFGLIVNRESNAVWDRLTLRYAAQGADWIETTYTLPHGTGRLDMLNRLHKPATLEKESVYFAFPFAGNPDIAMEITGGIVRPGSPHVPGSAQHFRAMRHWASITTEGQNPIAWVTREAPLVQVGNIAIPYSPFPPSIPDRDAHPATIYSWALNNLWDTNFPVKQGGELTFAYQLGIGADANAAADALGRDTAAAATSPLVGVAAASTDHAHKGTDRGSFLTIGNPDVELLHLRPGANGQGIAAVVMSHAGEPVETAIRSGDLTITAASIGNFLGEHMQPANVDQGTVRFRIAPGEMKLITLEVEILLPAGR